MKENKFALVTAKFAKLSCSCQKTITTELISMEYVPKSMQ